jgi:hypothetical protein
MKFWEKVCRQAEAAAALATFHRAAVATGSTSARRSLM